MRARRRRPSVRAETTGDTRTKMNSNRPTYKPRALRAAGDCKSRAAAAGAAAGAQAAWRGGPEWGRPRRRERTP